MVTVSTASTRAGPQTSKVPRSAADRKDRRAHPEAPCALSRPARQPHPIQRRQPALLGTRGSLLGREALAPVSVVGGVVDSERAYTTTTTVRR